MHGDGELDICGLFKKLCMYLFAKCRYIFLSMEVRQSGYMEM